jgi:hypothetical protein
MFKATGKHARQRARWVGPRFAYEAVRLAFDAKGELDAATAAQLAELAQP